MNMLVDYLHENNFLTEVFPRGRYCDFFPAFLELIKIKIDGGSITLSCKYSLKSLGIVLPLIAQENRKSYGFIRIHLEKLARAIYERESKKTKWGRHWFRIENRLLDHDESKEVVAKLKCDYEKTVQSLADNYKLALKKRTKKARIISIQKFELESQVLANELQRKIDKTESAFAKIFEVRISPIDNLDIRKEIEQIVFSYATHNLKSKELICKYFSSTDAGNKKKVIIKNVMDSLVREGVITSQGLPSDTMKNLGDLRIHIAKRLGSSRWERCLYCDTPFFKVYARGRAKRKYCDNPSCRTLAYRKRKRKYMKLPRH